MKMLVTPKYIKEYTSIGKNIDDAILLEAIEIISLTRLKPVLGDAYDIVLSWTYVDQAGKLQLSDNVPSYAYELITDYIQPLVSRWVVAHLYKTLTWKTRNAGNVQYQGEGYSVVTMQDADKMRVEMENIAQTYAYRLYDHLEEVGMPRGERPNRSPIYFPR